MPIVWRDAMSIDGGPIDEDHQFLITIANEVEDVLDGADRARILALLKKLQYYTVYHFVREEALQREIDFPDHEEHAGRHRQLIAIVENAVSLFSRDFTEDKSRRLANDLARLMNAWIIGHVLTQDIAMRPHVRMHRQGPRGVPLTTI